MVPVPIAMTHSLDLEPDRLRAACRFVGELVRAAGGRALAELRRLAHAGAYGLARSTGRGEKTAFSGNPLLIPIFLENALEKLGPREAARAGAIGCAVGMGTPGVRGPRMAGPVENTACLAHAREIRGGLP